MPSLKLRHPQEAAYCAENRVQENFPGLQCVYPNLEDLRMSTIAEFTIPDGDRRQSVRIWHNEFGTGGYVIYIDNWSMGELRKQNGDWIMYQSPRSWLQSEDIAILGEMIDEKLI